MARSSITGAERAPTQAEGRDVEALGPSDTSDSGSDVQGELDLASPVDLDNPTFGAEQPGLKSDSDAAGTGERGSALLDEEAREGADILPDDVRSLTGEDEDAEDVAPEAELEFEELSEADDFAVPDDGDEEE
ncbi:MAG TPA: hypothetical protein VF169_21105 [Albitalea sp.]|uniref:hypothetical protein n=1 Tax=Piscinibacter sp. TaxID=1903157 RepID=UPI002ED2284C